MSEPDRVARFEREARMLAALNHANIAALYGMEECDGRHFLVMELVREADLGGLPADLDPPLPELLRRCLEKSDRENAPAIFRQRADTSGAAERLTKPDEGLPHVPESWAP